MTPLKGVATVTGAIEAQELGATLFHEHIFVDLRRDAFIGNNVLNDPVLAESELQRFASAGGRTIVDQTSRGLGQDPAALRDLALRTGLQIVLGCGWYRGPFMGEEVDQSSTDGLAEKLVLDLTVGIDNTGIRAGLIGEIGSQGPWISAREERVLRAAARAHLRTNAVIATHSPGSLGIDQLSVLMEEGVDPSRVVIGHTQSSFDDGYHLELARMGAYVSIDRLGGHHRYHNDRQINLIASLVRAGYAEQVLVSHDVCYKSDLVAFGGTGYAYIPLELPDALEEAGLDSALLTLLTVDNPRRALIGH